MSTYNTKEIIESSLENVTNLKSQLERIEQMRLDVEKTIKLGKDIQAKFSELTNDFTNLTTDFVKENQLLLNDELSSFESYLKDLQVKIKKLDTLDLKTAFTDANKEFSNSLNDLFDKRFDDLHTLYDSFKNEVSDLNKQVKRLDSIDLEQHFNNHQNKLSSVLNTLTNISSTLISINENHLKTIEGLSDIRNLINQSSTELVNKIDTIGSDLNKLEKTLEEQANNQNQKFKLLMGFVIVGIIITIALKFI